MDKKSKYANFRARSRDYTDILRVISPFAEIFDLPLFLYRKKCMLPVKWTWILYSIFKLDWLFIELVLLLMILLPPLTPPPPPNDGRGESISVWCPGVHLSVCHKFFFIQYLEKIIVRFYKYFAGRLIKLMQCGLNNFK